MPTCHGRETPRKTGVKLWIATMRVRMPAACRLSSRAAMPAWNGSNTRLLRRAVSSGARSKLPGIGVSSEQHGNAGPAAERPVEIDQQARIGAEHGRRADEVGQVARHGGRADIPGDVPLQIGRRQGRGSCIHPECGSRRGRRPARSPAAESALRISSGSGQSAGTASASGINSAPRRRRRLRRGRALACGPSRHV